MWLEYELVSLFTKHTINFQSALSEHVAQVEDKNINESLQSGFLSDADFISVSMFPDRTEESQCEWNSQVHFCFPFKCLAKI